MLEVSVSVVISLPVIAIFFFSCFRSCAPLQAHHRAHPGSDPGAPTPKFLPSHYPASHERAERQLFVRVRIAVAHAAHKGIRRHRPVREPPTAPCPPRSLQVGPGEGRGQQQQRHLPSTAHDDKQELDGQQWPQVELRNCGPSVTNGGTAYNSCA